MAILFHVNNVSGPTPPISGPPTEIDNCILWLRSDAGITKDESNLVSLWEDQSGNNNHASQSNNTLKPIWAATGANGNPMLNFTAQNLDLNSIITGTQEVFIIYKAAGASATTKFLTKDSSYLGMYHEPGYLEVTTRVDVVTTDDNTNYYGAYSDHIWLNFNFRIQDMGGWVNAVTVCGGLTLAESADLAGACESEDIGNAESNGGIAEIIVYSSILSSEDRTTLNSYLNTRYGTT